MTAQTPSLEDLARAAGIKVGPVTLIDAPRAIVLYVTRCPHCHRTIDLAGRKARVRTQFLMLWWGVTFLAYDLWCLSLRLAHGRRQP